MKFAVTGASGFVGRALVNGLAKSGTVRALARTPLPEGTAGTFVQVNGADWPVDLFAGCSAVYHAAGRAHVYEKSADEARLFDEANRGVALKVAEGCIAAGVERLVFISSLSVHGDHADAPITETSPFRPATPYGVSKMNAEKDLAALFAGSATRLVVVRPPMIYGPACPGNFPRLVRLVRRGFPLPLGSVRTRRSFIHIDNLVDLLDRMANAEKAAGAYLAGDGSDFSLPELISAIASGLGMKARLLPFPPALLRAAGAALGKVRELNSLTLGLTVDWSKARRDLDWQPPLPAAEALRSAVDWYRRHPTG